MGSGSIGTRCSTYSHLPTSYSHHFFEKSQNPTRGDSDAFREHVTALLWHSRRRGAAPPPGAIGRSKKSRSRRRGTAKLRARGALTGVGTFGHCDKASRIISGSRGRYDGRNEAAGADIKPQVDLVIPIGESPHSSRLVDKRTTFTEVGTVS